MLKIGQLTAFSRNIERFCRTYSVYLNLNSLFLICRRRSFRCRRNHRISCWNCPHTLGYPWSAQCCQCSPTAIGQWPGILRHPQWNYYQLQRYQSFPHQQRLRVWKWHRHRSHCKISVPYVQTTSKLLIQRIGWTSRPATCKYHENYDTVITLHSWSKIE